MKKGIILNLKKFKLLDYVTHNKIFILLSALYIVGILIGVFMVVDNSKISSNTKTFLNDYIQLHSSSSFFNKLITRFINCFIILILYFLSGTSMFGVAVTPFLMLWQGILFGSLSSQMYSMYGISGIAFNAIIIIPTTIIFVICCFFAARYSIDFSLQFARLTLPHSKPTNLYISFKKYCFNYLILITITFLFIIFEIVLNLFFLKFFNF